jgi:hypothetical protein
MKIDDFVIKVVQFGKAFFMIFNKKQRNYNFLANLYGYFNAYFIFVS